MTLYLTLLRVFVVSVGSVAVVWGATQLSTFGGDRSIERIASRIIAGDQFKPEILKDQISSSKQVEQKSICRPSELRSVAIVRLRLAEVPETQIQEPLEIRTKAAANAIRSSLACSPEDAFLWLALFAIETPAPLSYLRASYRLGPNEGWIALKRNPIAFMKFGQLPPDLRNTVVSEFLGILRMGFYDEAVKILTATAWDNRDFVLSRVANLERRHRQGLANGLAAAGYDAIVPGTERGK